MFTEPNPTDRRDAALGASSAGASTRPLVQPSTYSGAASIRSAMRERILFDPGWSSRSGMASRLADSGRRGPDSERLIVVATISKYT